jgi:hypothetical protein
LPLFCFFKVNEIAGANVDGLPGDELAGATEDKTAGVAGANGASAKMEQLEIN